MVREEGRGVRQHLSGWDVQPPVRHAHDIVGAWVILLRRPGGRVEGAVEEYHCPQGIEYIVDLPARRREGGDPFSWIAIIGMFQKCINSTAHIAAINLRPVRAGPAVEVAPVIMQNEAAPIE